MCNKKQNFLKQQPAFNHLKFIIEKGTNNGTSLQMRKNPQQCDAWEVEGGEMETEIDSTIDSPKL